MFISYIFHQEKQDFLFEKLTEKNVAVNEQCPERYDILLGRIYST